MRFCRTAVFFAALSLLSSVPAYAGPGSDGPTPPKARPVPPYQLLDEGFLGRSSYFSDVNRSAVAVGETTMSWGQEIGFRYSEPDLFPEFGFTQQGHSIALGINSRGDVVGSSQIGYMMAAHAYFRKAGSSTPIDTHPAGFSSSIARAVNSDSTVVGMASLPDYSQTAFVWSASRGAKTLPNLDEERASGKANAKSINDAGIIVGSSGIYCENSGMQMIVPVIWTLDRGGEYQVQALPMPGGGACNGPIAGFGEATSINEKNVIVGYTAAPGQVNKASLWRRDDAGVWKLSEAGLNTVYYDINNAGQMVGHFRLPDLSSEGGLNINGTWFRATDLVGTLPDWDMKEFSFSALNDAGDIVGHGRKFINGVPQYRAVMFKKRLP